MPVEIVQVDSFTDRPFGGNPAAVCVLPEARDERWMQNVALEMNLSETAFLVRGDGEWNLRWFTPAREVDLCGHATLASAHVLWEDGHAGEGEALAFATKSGSLSAKKSGAWIEMDFPAEPPEQTTPPAELLASLGAEAVFVGRNRFDYIVEVQDEETLLAVEPDFGALGRLGARGVIVTSLPSTPGFDFVSRYFAPAFGVNEDPVTGSAHCCLGPYWRDRLGRDSLTAKQISARGGVVKVTVAGDRTILAGQAVTMLRATLMDW